MELFSSWDREYGPDDSLHICSILALAHVGACKSAPPYCPDILEIESAIRRHDFGYLCNYEPRYGPEDFTPLSIFHLRQAVAFFQKNTSPDIGVDRDQVAYTKFVESESLCRKTNEIFRLWSQGRFSFSPDVESWFFRAQRKIARVLGPVPKLSELRLRYGPGSTTSTKKRMASVREKLHARFACSEELAPYAQSILDELPVLAGLHLEVLQAESLPVSIETGKVTFVPKSAKTNRTVVTEPVLNGMLQLGYGDFISARLRAVGVDTRDQSLNQRLACAGSLTGALATLDLSSASDTISTELVFHLLPVDWAFALSACRTRKVSLRGEPLTQEKFSSMGNGFTFPLETLIFWALARSCCGDEAVVSVYGDDIVVPSSHYGDVCRLLWCAGFEVNSKKSFHVGPFRESCGKDYYKGIDVRPYYQKSAVSPSTLFSLHNFYARRKLDDFLELVLNFIHPSLRIFGPDGYGDGHLLGDWSPRPYKRNIGYGGFLFDTFTWKQRRDVRPVLPGDWIVPLYSVYLRDAYLAVNERVEMPVRHFHGDPSPPPNWTGFSFPGKRGYKRISIYTLSSR